MPWPSGAYRRAGEGASDAALLGARRQSGAGRAGARPLALPAGLEVEWLGVSGYRLTCDGHTLFIDPYVSRVPFRDLLLRRPDDPRPRRAGSLRRGSGETVGVLVGHTHFDHAVDAPAIARRFDCKAYGSSSLATLMGLHGLAERAVEVEPYRTYELGPFEVSFTPSVHSKLLLGLAVPYDGELTCEHLDSLSPGAYRCGQVWGISIEVAGVRFYHQGSANLIDDAIRERERRRLPRRRRRPQLHPRLLEADPAPPQPPRRGPHPLRQLLPPARPPDGVRLQRQALRAAGGDRLGQRRHRAGRPAPLRSTRLEASPSSAWRRSARSCPSCAGVLAEDGLDRLQVELGLEQAATGQPVKLATLDRQPILVVRQRQHFLARRRGRLLQQQRNLELAFGGLDELRLERLRRRRSPRPRRRFAGRPAPRSRATSPRPLSISCASDLLDPPSCRSKITLPLARKVATSLKPQSSNRARSSSFLIRRPPRFIPRRKAT